MHAKRMILRLSSQDFTQLSMDFCLLKKKLYVLSPFFKDIFYERKSLHNKNAKQVKYNIFKQSCFDHDFFKIILMVPGLNYHRILKCHCPFFLLPHLDLLSFSHLCIFSFSSVFEITMSIVSGFLLNGSDWSLE